MQRRCLIGCFAICASFWAFGCGSNVTDDAPKTTTPQEASDEDPSRLDQRDGSEEVATVRQASATTKNFGTDCQEAFENNWQDTLHYAWETCNGFNGAMDDFANKEYYYNLRGAQDYWEIPNDQNRLERVDLAFSNTHGGTNSSQAFWTMWDSGVFATSPNMWLGNESKGLSIWATYSCETLKDDGNLWARWDTVMAGGLRIVVGSHDTVWSAYTTDEVGRDFAENLESGMSIRNSWRYGLEDWYHDQDAAVMSTGTDSSDCNGRLTNMDWDNFDNYPRRTSTNPGWWCEDHWSNM